MRTIPLSPRGWVNRGKYVAVVDDDDYGYLSGFMWHALVQGTATTRRVYAVRYPEVRMHREIWARSYGTIPTGKEIDHIEPGEFCGLDNRKINLRLTNKSLNQANERRSSNNTSGFKGVWWQRQARMWRADIWVRGQKRHLGYFTDKAEAALAYDVAAKEAFGEHARVNFPEKVPA